MRARPGMTTNNNATINQQQQQQKEPINQICVHGWKGRLGSFLYAWGDGNRMKQLKHGATISSLDHATINQHQTNRDPPPSTANCQWKVINTTISNLVN